MNTILEIKNLCKKYPKFNLTDVSFEIEKGKIMGFIGRNGAGKTTTLKSIMNLVHYDKGEVIVFGKNMNECELENKQRIGFALSELNYYPNRTIKQLVNVTKRFYKNFDEEKFKKACDLFKLDTNKKLEELSSGMKVKYSVAIALSHNAELLILDEPTSGLDPISRDEVLDIFRNIVKSKERSILFSTHITSDLDKCATDITYIHDGQIKYTGTKNDFINSYYYVKDDESKFNVETKRLFIESKEYDGKIEGLIASKDKEEMDRNNIFNRVPDLEEVMIYLEKEKQNESFDF